MHRFSLRTSGESVVLIFRLRQTYEQKHFWEGLGHGGAWGSHVPPNPIFIGGNFVLHFGFLAL